MPNDSTVLGATFGACEERFFPVEDDRTDGAFDGASKCASVPRECLADGVGRTCPFEWSDQGLCVATSGMHRRAARPLCCRVRRRSRHCGRECSSIANNSAMCIRGCPHKAQTGGWKTGRACPLCPTASVSSCAFAIWRNVKTQATTLPTGAHLASEERLEQLLKGGIRFRFAAVNERRSKQPIFRRCSHANRFIGCAVAERVSNEVGY
jgi:hypothetical protein